MEPTKCYELPDGIESPNCKDVRNDYAKRFVITRDGSGIPLTKIIGLTLYFKDGNISGSVTVEPTVVKTIKSWRKNGGKIGFHFA